MNFSLCTNMSGFCSDSHILNHTLQVSHVTSNTTVIHSLMSEFSEVFEEELGVLKGTLQLNYNQQPSLAFVKPTSTFCIKGES